MVLSAEDKSAVIDLLQSTGWKVLTDKVWPAQEKIFLTHLRNADKDHRFYQGLLTGFEYAEDLAQTCGQEPKHQPASTPYPSEFDLIARR